MFRACYEISQMKAYQISLLNGYIFGAGTGISMNAPFIIATENSCFGLPENEIGQTAYIGSEYYMRKMISPELALYVQMLCKKLVGKQLAEVGLAHYFVPASKLRELEEQLKKQLNQKMNREQIHSIIKEYSIPIVKQQEHLEIIQKAFMIQNKFEDFYQNFQRFANSNKTAENLFSELNSKKFSPLSIRLNYELFKKSQQLKDIKQCYELDSIVSRRMIEDPDTQAFQCIKEKLLNHKNFIKWKYKNLFDISDKKIEEYFQPYKNHNIFL